MLAASRVSSALIALVTGHPSDATDPRATATDPHVTSHPSPIRPSAPRPQARGRTAAKGAMGWRGALQGGAHCREGRTAGRGALQGGGHTAGRGALQGGAHCSPDPLIGRYGPAMVYGPV